MSGDRRAEALERAIRFEQEGRAFFLGAAAKVSNLLAKAMLEQIAREEDDHIEYIRTVSRRLEAAGEWPEFRIDDRTYDRRLREIFTAEAERIGTGIAIGADDLAVVEQARQIEARGRAMYSALRDEAAPGFERDFYATLADMEYSHFRSFADTLEYLTDPAAWHAGRERSGLDGA